MPASTRRLTPLFLAGLFLVPLAGTVEATAESINDEVLRESGRNLIRLTNDERSERGLRILRVDPQLMAIARDRAAVMAANDVMSHTEPNGQKVFARLDRAGLTWYGAGEIIAWNNYPTAASSVAESIRAWLASPGHREIMVSTGYNYIGFGAAVSASGKRYYSGVFVREPDETVPWVEFDRVTRHYLDARHVRVTVRWSGGDVRLQVLTAGLRSFDLQRRVVGGTWHRWVRVAATAASRSLVWNRGADHEVRIRGRDNNGNVGPWQVIRIDL